MLATSFSFTARIFSRIGLVTTLLFNTVLIYLTIFHTKQITGAFKYLTLKFSLVCVSFSCLDFLAHPYLHSYNGGFISFSLNELLNVSDDVLKLLLEAYSGSYVGIECILAVQFLFRYATLTKHRRILATFDGWNFIIWIIYSLFFCIMCGLLMNYCAQPEPYSDAYMKKELMRVYKLEITKTARFTVIAYEVDGSVRWWNLMFLFGAMIILGFQYVVITFCWVQMQKKMKQELLHFSIPHRKLQQQFFKALVVQITIPTLFLHLPAFPVLISPFFHTQISFETGFIYAVFSLYPPIEAVAFMWIVSEYRCILKKMIFRKTNTEVQSWMRVSSML